MGKQRAASVQTVRHACTPRTGTFDPSRRDTVFDLTDLVHGHIEPVDVCVVISDLKATYGGGGFQIVAALNDLEAETGRSAMNLEPVRMNTDEFYHILRRRLFERLPDEAGIEAVAQAYGKAVREAKQVDVTDSLTWLHTELADNYWPQREALGAVLRCLAAVDIDHWLTDAAAAHLVAGAVENDHV